MRVNAVGHRQQFSRTGEIRDVGVGLAGEDRVAGKAERLRSLDLGVPIGTLHQSHHDPAVIFFRERVEPVDGEGRARTIGLDDDTKPVPAGKFRLRQNTFDDVERQIEPVGLLGIDVEAHARMPRGKRQ